MKSAFLEKLLERIQRVQPEDVQNYLVDLAREKGFLETIFNSIQEGIIVTDTAGRIIYLNNAACSMFALHPDDSLGKHLSDQVRGLDWNELSTGDSVINREMEVFYPENRFLNFYVVPLMEDEGGVAGRAIILRDTTREREATEQTIESERFSALTLLAAGVAHEIGNPLNSLSIHLSLMERKLRNVPEKTKRSLLDSIKIAREEVSRLDHIITQFLRAIRPTPLQTSMANLNTIVQESVDFLSAEIRDRDILVEQVLDPALPPVEIDRDQIKQAFYNIIRNAFQAMKTGGILRIETAATETHICVRFTDTGGGISLENMPRLFEPYFTTRKSGSGLGLLIVRRIVREHGGEVMIESTEGKGTTFIIRLPRFDRRVRLLEAGSSRPPSSGDQTN